MMILQEIQFPKAEICTAAALYFRVSNKLQNALYDGQEAAIHLKKYQYVYLDTLFNSFSIEKWMKYTKLSNLQIELDLEGSFLVQVLRKYLIDNKLHSEILSTQIVSAKMRTSIAIDIPCRSGDKGIICVTMDSLANKNAFYGGRYTTEIDESELNSIDIAIDICTFKRESFIKKNICLMNQEIFQNERSCMYGHLHVFVSDNGQTLDAKSLESEKVHIYPNKNAGGAGGFCRGMMEILDYQKKEAHKFSHVLVMDDDVVINPDAIIRTYQFLRFMKPQFAEKTIAGAMMRLDDAHIQHECGGWWNGDEVRPVKSSADMIDIMNILRNEQELPINFNAWWYSCIPMSKISNENLPLPIFIRFDDVEFGLRSGSDILTLNGICLWHEPFDFKYSSSMEYYHMRNCLIINALHKPEFDAATAVKHMRYMVLSNLVRYRYKNIELICRAVEDFCEGPQKLFSKDVEALHKEIMGLSDKFEPLEALRVLFDESAYLRRWDFSESKGHRWIRMLTGNGLLLRAKGIAYVGAAINVPLNFYRKKKVLNYDVVSNRGFVSEKSWSETIRTLRRFMQVSSLLKKNHARLCREYRTAKPEITSRAFWNRYLGLTQKESSK